MKKKQKNGKKVCYKFLAALLICGSLVGCGNSNTAVQEEASYSNDSYEADYDVSDTDDLKVEGEMAEDMGFQQNASKGDVADFTNSSTTEENIMDKNDTKKIIKRYDYSYETEAFDQAYAYLKQQIDAYDGYIASSEIYGTGKRTLYITARIPAQVSDKFVEQLGSLGTMLSQSESAEDITLKYADTASKITSLKTEQERLLALLEKADSLESIITLEDRLTDVRYELERYESQRKVYDDLVTYSTVSITLEEVTYTIPVDDTTVFTRIKTGLTKTFRDIRMSFADFLVGFVVNFPYFVIWAFILLVIVFVVKKLIKGNRKKKEKQEQKKQDEKTKEHKEIQGGK